MIKKIILIAFILLVPYRDTDNVYALVGGGHVGALSCTLYDSFTTGEDAQFTIARYNASEYAGTTFIDSGQANSACQVDWYITARGGDPSVNDYYVEIWTLSGDNLSVAGMVANGRSNKVDGGVGGAWNNSWISFTFSTPPTLAQSTTYAVFLKAIDDGDAAATIGEYDETNYVIVGMHDGNNDTTRFGGRWAWDSGDLSNTTKDVEDDLHVKIYTMQ